MKVLANSRICALFGKIALYAIILLIISTLLIGFQIEHASIFILMGSFCMIIGILISSYRYFKKQQMILENAVAQITDYLSGNQEARIPCNEEGELYVLFHEVNSLAAILNARAENEIRSKEFLKNSISDISHQLKTPLAALNIYNGILQNEAENAPTIQEFTNLSEQELDRIDTLVQNLLKITKLDAGTLVMTKSMENVAGLFDVVKEHFRYRCELEKKQLQLEGAGDVFLECDSVWIVEAFDNIVKNALDHTDSGDFIHIRWKKFAAMIQIMIEDNGYGIHPEDLNFIFKRFYRSKFSKDTQGVGLGLPLAKAIIEEHNGTIEVDSELGIGTTFVINFLIPTKL